MKTNSDIMQALLANPRRFVHNFTDDDFWLHAAEFYKREVELVVSREKRLRMGMILKTLHRQDAIREALRLLKEVEGKSAVLTFYDSSVKGCEYDATLNIHGRRDLIYVSSGHLPLMVYILLEYGDTVLGERIPTDWFDADFVQRQTRPEYGVWTPWNVQRG